MQEGIGDTSRYQAAKTFLFCFIALGLILADRA